MRRMIEILLFLVLGGFSLFIAKKWIFRRSKWAEGVQSKGIEFKLKEDRRITFKLGMIASLAFFLIAFNIETVEGNTFPVDPFDMDTTLFFDEPPLPMIKKEVKKMETKPKVQPKFFKPKPVELLIQVKKEEVSQIPDIDDEIPDLPEEDDEIAEEPIHVFVESMPEFPGGHKMFNKFVASNIIYPQTAQEIGIDGTVHIRFTVNKDGSITDVKVAKSVHPLLDNAAMEVIKSMPKWKPGKQSGRPVRVSQVLPVKFTSAF